MPRLSNHTSEAEAGRSNPHSPVSSLPNESPWCSWTIEHSINCHCIPSISLTISNIFSLISSDTTSYKRSVWNPVTCESHYHSPNPTTHNTLIIPIHSLQQTTQRTDALHCVLLCPLSSRFTIQLGILLAHSGNFGHQRIVGIGVIQKGAYRQ